MKKSDDEILELIFAHLIEGKRFDFDIFIRMNNLEIDYTQRKRLIKIVEKHTEQYYDKGKADYLSLTKESMELFKINKSYRHFISNEKRKSRLTKAQHIMAYVAIASIVANVWLGIENRNDSVAIKEMQDSAKAQAKTAQQLINKLSQSKWETDSLHIQINKLSEANDYLLKKLNGEK